MAKRVRDSGLETRAARTKLKARGKPYFKAIAQGLHLGYRKGRTEGKWVVRRYNGAQTYITDTIATADDHVDADGTIILNFWQAQERARTAGAALAYAGPYRVRDAVEAYRRHLEGKATAYDGGIRFERHVLPVLGEELCDKLTAAQIREWHRDLARSMPTIPNAARTRDVDLRDPEVARKRQVSANRVLTSLKAALNQAFRDGKVTSDAEWRKVAPFRKVERARNNYLSLAEAKRLINAADEDFRPLVRGALETGCRYGELCRLRVGDFNSDSGTIRIRMSKSGDERHVILSAAGAAFFAQLTAGRAASAPMFGREWGASHQVRRMVDLCKRARIEPHVGFHQLRHTWASHAVMAGMPLAVVARNLGHVDSKMTEKHYGHLAPSYLVDQVRMFAPDFGKVRGNIKAIR